VSEATLRDLVKEWKSTGPLYRSPVQTVMQSSYRSHDRRMLPRLLETLEFRSNNAMHQPLMRALALVRQYLQSRQQTSPVGEEIPLDGVLREAWRDGVLVTDPQGRTRVNRIAYELCVLQGVRDRLRCKELWVVGADRYRNPDDDVPSDFATQRSAYYAALDRTLPHNADVEILAKGKGWITLSPLPPHPEPPNLVALKAEIARRWPMTSVLDVLKETDVRVGFTHALQRPTAWENVDRATLQYRLLFTLYGLGTGAGLKRVHVGNPEVT
jgi:hypothetical protein